MSTHCYYEIRAMRLFGPPMPVASDIARHLQSRQYLGVTIVVCDSPVSMMSAMRKQWLRLARNLQKQRASTLNAEEILRFTHTIMHMQHLQFSVHLPTAKADGNIFFVTPSQLDQLPPGCLSLYLTTQPRAKQLKKWIEGLAADALVIDYEGTLGLEASGLEPKIHIEQRMRQDWADLIAYMRRHGANIAHMVRGTAIQPGAMDAALDAMLSVGNTFLRRAADFQHMLSLSQPLKHEPAEQIKQFEAVMRLAHRVQTLTPGAFGLFLAHSFGESNADSFFLRDAAPEADDFFATDPDEQISYEDMLGVALRMEYN